MNIDLAGYVEIMDSDGQARLHQYIRGLGKRPGTIQNETNAGKRRCDIAFEGRFRSLADSVIFAASRPARTRTAPRFFASDCGGIPGLCTMLEAVVDPNHPNHAEAKRFSHKFLLNDTFAAAKRVNPELALNTVSRRRSTDWQSKRLVVAWTLCAH